MASGKTVKGSKSDFEKMIKDLGLSKAEIADMLGLTKRDPKTGIRRKKGGSMSSAKNKKMPYKKKEPKKSILEKQMSIVMPKQQTMKRGKRVGSAGAITQQQRMAMGKK